MTGITKEKLFDYTQHIIEERIIKVRKSLDRKIKKHAKGELVSEYKPWNDPRIVSGELYAIYAYNEERGKESGALMIPTSCYAQSNKIIKSPHFKGKSERELQMMGADALMISLDDEGRVVCLDNAIDFKESHDAPRYGTIPVEHGVIWRKGQDSQRSGFFSHKCRAKGYVSIIRDKVYFLRRSTLTNLVKDCDSSLKIESYGEKHYAKENYKVPIERVAAGADCILTIPCSYFKLLQDYEEDLINNPISSSRGFSNKQWIVRLAEGCETK